MDLRGRIVAELEAARRRSLDLLAPVPDADLVRQHSPLMSPLVWDLAHVGNYEELWLLRAVAGSPPLDAGLDDIYDAFRHPRPNRPSLPLLGPADARRYIGDVRGRALDVLDRLPLDDESRPLLADAFVYGMVVQHEHQHDETMLATLQLMEGDTYRPASTLPPPASAGLRGPNAMAGLRGPNAVAGLPDDVVVPAGPFVMGTTDEGWAYDNERPAHVVDLAAFRIDTTPVTNRRYLGFVEDGGYDDPRHWSTEGWAWRTTEAAAHPLFWARQGRESWARRRFGWHEDLPPDEPVQHVCFHEAEAFARWAGRRLPTEAEWEKAASWTPDGHKRRFPWGDEDADPSRANLGQRHFRPSPVGAYPDGASPYGVHQLVGDVWEWTSSDFAPYPGFRSFPYREYSEVFFGSGYKVLRGGSWATDPAAVRTTFRNWDHPIRRQIFSGFRTAADG